jgi:hypothetical protein
MKNIFNTLVTVLRWIYLKTPSQLDFLFWPSSIVIRCYHIFRLDQWLLSGQEIHSQQLLTMLYTGIRQNKCYIASLAYNEDYQEQYLGRKWIWEVSFKRLCSNESLIITEVHNVLYSLFSRKIDFYIPGWVEGQVILPRDLLRFVKTSRSLNHNRQNFTKNRLYPQIVSGSSQLFDFYKNMYVPYIHGVHGDRAFIESYPHIKKMFGNCQVLQIKKDDMAVAGCLFQVSKTKARLLVLGVKDGNRDFVKQGAIGALYYFTFKHLLERGYTSVHLGKSRAFLNDGILIFKKRWGLRITGLSGMGLAIKVLSGTDGVKGFLYNNPFIFKEKRELKEARFIESSQTISGKDYQHIENSSSLKGISKIAVYSLSGERLVKISDLPYLPRLEG